MRKFFLINIAMLIVSIPTFAGGYLTNTNQHAAFLRMLSRGATFEIDGALSNPAGLAFMKKDGFHMGLSIQSAFQKRNIDASFQTFKGVQFNPAKGECAFVHADKTFNKFYKGKAAAPVIPSLFAAYKKGDWTISGFFAITGGGGKASFDDGLPMFESAAMAGIFAGSVPAFVQTQGKSPLVTPEMCEISSAMDGKQYIYSAQMGLTYKVNDWLAVFGGARMNYFTGGYEGYLTANLKKEMGGKELVNLALDCDQTGWGLTPVIGVDVKLGKLNIGAKYEFMTNLNIENDTKKNTDENGALAAFKHGVNTPNDIPSMLSVAAAYEFLPVLRGSVEYHFYDDKNAGMAGGKEKFLTKGTNEYLFGVEWDVIDRLTISCGGQITDYGLSDNFQSDTSFSCDSYSIGVGAKIQLSERAALNVGYMWTNYDDYTKKYTNSDITKKLSQTASPIKFTNTDYQGTNVYSRENKVFGVSLNYSF